MSTSFPAAGRFAGNSSCGRGICGSAAVGGSWWTGWLVNARQVSKDCFVESSFIPVELYLSVVEIADPGNGGVGGSDAAARTGEEELATKRRILSSPKGRCADDFRGGVGLLRRECSLLNVLSQSSSTSHECISS
jgi:hypothetical protein